MAGLATCRALRARGLPFDCYEMSDRVGGLWVYGNKNGRSPAYASLHINSSKWGTAFSDFPMPDDYPVYPRHDQVAAYFDSYAERFGLKPHIRFGTEVVDARRAPDGAWTVELQDGSRHTYDALFVCNGHHWKPHLPTPPPGHFDGVEIHSHEYRTPEAFAGKNVVVVGLGNSALDVACDLKDTAENVYLSSRRGAYIAPKFIFGVPVDQVLPKLRRLPGAKRFLKRDQLAWIFTQLIRISVGDVEKYGLLAPSQGLFNSHISAHSYIFGALMDGSVRARPGLVERMGDRVRFADGSVVAADVIVYCTGYRISFPFLDPSIATVGAGNEFPLFWNVFKPGVPNLFFIGLIDAQASIHPLSEMQARWAASCLLGEYALPDVREMEAHCEWVTEYRKKTWVDSQRHGVEWHYFEYVPGLNAEIEAGKLRAKQARGVPRRPAAPAAAAREGAPPATTFRT